MTIRLSHLARRDLDEIRRYTVETWGRDQEQPVGRGFAVLRRRFEALRYLLVTANRLLSELAAQWLENREWPRTEVQIQVARSSLFTAQAVARDMIAAGREKEVEEIHNSISSIVPDVEHSTGQPDHSGRR